LEIGIGFFEGANGGTANRVFSSISGGAPRPALQAKHHPRLSNVSVVLRPRGFGVGPRQQIVDFAGKMASTIRVSVLAR